MKTRLLLPVLLVALSLGPAFSQSQATPSAVFPVFPTGTPSGQRPPETPKLTTFSLDFPGGTPQQLVTAIEKAMSKPLNVIIPAEHADFKLPPLKMNKVDVAQLFQALEATSRKTETYHPPGTTGWDQRIQTSYGFRTPDAQSGALSGDSIWYFYVEKPAPLPPFVPPVVPKVCRFYPLTSHLERGLTVDDITTAIQTGWKMLGDEETPKISFHKETKLLIAVGEAGKLEIIDAVLKAVLPPPRVPSAAAAAFAERYGIQRAPAPVIVKPPEEPKTEN